MNVTFFSERIESKKQIFLTMIIDTAILACTDQIDIYRYKSIIGVDCAYIWSYFLRENWLATVDETATFSIGDVNRCCCSGVGIFQFAFLAIVIFTVVSDGVSGEKCITRWSRYADEVNLWGYWEERVNEIVESYQLKVMYWI